MGPGNCRTRFVCVYTVFIMVTAGFIGLLVIENVTDEGGVEAAVVTVGPSGSGALYNSIQTAIDAAESGDTILVFEGIYYENLQIGKQLTLVGNGSEVTTIDGSSNLHVVSITADGVNMNGFKVANSSTSAGGHYAGIKIDQADNCMIESCNLTDTQYGIYLYQSSWNTINNNTCIDDYKFGIYIDGSSNTVSNNTCRSIDGTGICVGGSSSNVIFNNICDYNDDIGIYLGLSSGNTIYNNTCNQNDESGIEFYSSTNNVILNNTLHNNHEGINLESSSSGNSIMENSCHYNHCGIRLDESPNNEIGNNTSSLNDGQGIFLDYSVGNSIVNNIINSNTYSGISLDYASNDNIIVNNTCNFNIDNGIRLMDLADNFVARNTCESNNVNGIRLYNTLGNRIENNLCQLNGYNGIELYSSEDAIIENNTCNNNTLSGIYLYDESDSNLIHNNTCLDNVNGIRLFNGPSNNILDNNTCSNDSIGIEVFMCNSNTIENNTADGNVLHGIYLRDADLNWVSNNSCSSNGNGTYLYWFCNGNVIYRNYISSNLDNGILLTNCASNKIFYNSIISNAVQASDDGTNTWNNMQQEGNYWSDYQGVDNGAFNRVLGDGIGDTNLLHLGLDNYPFVNELGWLYPAVPNFVDPTEIDFDGNHTLWWFPAKRVTGYVLEEDDSDNFDTPTAIYTGPESSFNVTHGTEGTYYYRVRGFNDNYQSIWSNIVDLMVNWLPPVPQNLVLSVYPHGNAINISWTPNQIDTEEYLLYYKSTLNWIFLTNLTHPNNVFDHFGLQDGTTYYYRIQAKDALDQLSDFSVIHEATPADSMAPLPPTGLNATPIMHDQIQLSWEANTEEDIDGYYIYRSLESSPSDWGPPINGNTLVSGTQYSDDALAEIVKYFYVITASDEVPNESDRSQVATATTLLGPHGPEVNNSVSDFTIGEDTFDNSTVNLLNWFNDINHDPLEFRCEGNVNIDVEINQISGNVSLRSKLNWNGKETLTFFASDGDEEIFDDVKIEITGINDPPTDILIHAPVNNTFFYEDETINFEGGAKDVDLIYNDALAYSWSSNISGVIGSGSTLNDNKLQVGVHLITLTVTDREKAMIKATIVIEIIPKEIPPDDDGMADEVDGDESKEPDAPTDDGDTDGSSGDGGAGVNPDNGGVDTIDDENGSDSQPIEDEIERGVNEKDDSMLLLGIFIVLIIIALVGFAFLMKMRAKRFPVNKKEAQPSIRILEPHKVITGATSPLTQGHHHKSVLPVPPVHAGTPHHDKGIPKVIPNKLDLLVKGEIDKKDEMISDGLIQVIEEKAKG